MYSLLLILFHIFMSLTRIESLENAVSLCDNPVIHSADRLVNGSILLYRDNHYWELKGLPDREGFVLGPFPIWYQNFAPIHRNTSTLTCIECNRKGYVYKFQGLRFWSWEPSGRQWMGGKDGEKFKYLPITANSNATGFNAVFHNGLPNNPMMIGISGNRVFYYSTKLYDIEPPFGYHINGYEGGRDGENFPTDVTAAFSWFSPKEDEYQVYFFKEDKYCFRGPKLKSGQQCDQWLENRELFGCNKLKKKSSENDGPGVGTIGVEARNPLDEKVSDNKENVGQNGSQSNDSFPQRPNGKEIIGIEKIAVICALFVFTIRLFDSIFLF